jgi:hypothetical protein
MVCHAEMQGKAKDQDHTTGEEGGTPLHRLSYEAQAGDAQERLDKDKGGIEKETDDVKDEEKIDHGVVKVKEEEEVEEFLLQIPIDWSLPDDPSNPDYKAGLQLLAESIAGQLGDKIPALVGQGLLSGGESVPSWLPQSLHKNCAPASAFLQGLLKKCDQVFLEFNKNSVDKEEGLISR